MVVVRNEVTGKRKECRGVFPLRDVSTGEVLFGMIGSAPGLVQVGSSDEGAPFHSTWRFLSGYHLVELNEGWQADLSPGEVEDLCRGEVYLNFSLALPVTIERTAGGSMELFCEALGFGVQAYGLDDIEEKLEEAIRLYVETAREGETLGDIVKELVEKSEVHVLPADLYVSPVTALWKKEDE